MDTRKERLFIPFGFSLGLMLLALGVLQGAGPQIVISLVLIAGLSAIGCRLQGAELRISPRSQLGNHEPEIRDSRSITTRPALLGVGRVIVLGIVFTGAILTTPGTAYPASLRSALACVSGPHSGTISASEEWCAADNPHILTGDVTVGAGVTLTIQPGVVVKGQSNAQLHVQGHLAALGTPTQPITFTSAADSGPEGWEGLVFDGGTGELRHTTVRYGGSWDDFARSNLSVLNVTGGEVRLESSQVISGSHSGYTDYGLYVNNSHVVISDTLFADTGGNNNSDSALYATGAGTLVTVTNSTFQNNAGYPVRIQPYLVHRVSVTGGAFTGNYRDRLLIAPGAVVTGAALSPQTGPYELSPHLIVPAGVTLTVESGTQVMGQGSAQLKVQGHLAALGTPTQPITFTSAADSGPEGWEGLVFDGGTGELRHTTVRYGGSWDDFARSNLSVLNVTGGEVRLESSQVISGSHSGYTDYGLYVNNSHVVISDTLFADTGGNNSSDSALYATGAGTLVTVTNSTFQNNAGSGVATNDGQTSISCSNIASNNIGVYAGTGVAPSVVVSDSNISGNVSYGVRNDNAGVTVDAQGNWWGAADGPSGAGPGSGDVVSGNVLFDPWLVAVSPCAVLEPDIEATPNPVNFGNVVIGGTAIQSITVSNVGWAALNITNVTLPGAPFSIITDNCSGQTVPAHSSCTIDVQFAPGAAGSYTDSITITSNDPDEPNYVVNLLGNGVTGGVPDFSLACAPSSLDIPQGESDTSTCTVTSLNGFNAAVDLSCDREPAGVTCAFNPPSVTPPANGVGTSTLTVSVAITAPVGSSIFPVVGSSGQLRHNAPIALNVLTPSRLRAEALIVDEHGYSLSQNLIDTLPQPPNLNGVLEPNEAVMVEPGWANLGTHSVSLAGRAFHFTGPGDPGNYFILDHIAGYGNIPAGSKAICYDGTGDCYILGVAAPLKRPADHWDATFDERLSTGEIKTWKVHIGESFADVSLGDFAYRYIETMLHHRITSGCLGTPFKYCPGDPTTRGQMAAFIARSLEEIGAMTVTPCSVDNPSPFGDVSNDDPFCDDIKAIYEAGITAGCGDGSYCPDDPTSRAQMAALVVRALVWAGRMAEPAACSVENPSPFSDVPNDYIFCPQIKALYDAGVVVGCIEGMYCPDADALRSQSAIVIVNGFQFKLYGPEWAESPCATPDFDSDGDVDVKDLQTLAAAWRDSPPADMCYDRDGDSKVTIIDIMEVARSLGW